MRSEIERVTGGELLLDEASLAGMLEHAWGLFTEGRVILRNLASVSIQRDLFHGFTFSLVGRPTRQGSRLYQFQTFVDTRSR